MSRYDRLLVLCIGSVIAACLVVLMQVTPPAPEYAARPFPSSALPPATTSVERPVRAVEIPEPAAPAALSASAAPRETTGATAGSGPSTPVEDLIRNRFIQIGGPSVAEQAVRVARCESHLDPTARSGAHWGLFQISDRYHSARIERLGYSWPDLLSAGPNIAVAADLSMEQGWTPWSCRP